MNAVKVLCIGSALMMSAMGLLAQQDKPGSKDHPLLTRMEGYYIYSYDQREFDRFAFPVRGPDGKTESKVMAEGRKTEFNYCPLRGAPRASALQIIRNYQNALTELGGKVLCEKYQCETTIQLVRKGQETWVWVSANRSSREYRLVIIEKGEMQQEVIANAEVWRVELNTTGHAIAHGIYFDQSKADLKPESEAAFKEIAKLLQQDPKLTLFVVGHTEMLGDFNANIKLSVDRAAAVVGALTSRYGVSPSRLFPYGVGPLSPVAPNDTEEGRAKNRRVELVKR